MQNRRGRPPPRRMWLPWRRRAWESSPRRRSANRWRRSAVARPCLVLKWRRRPESSRVSNLKFITTKLVDMSIEPRNVTRRGIRVERVAGSHQTFVSWLDQSVWIFVSVAQSTRDPFSTRVGRIRVWKGSQPRMWFSPWQAQHVRSGCTSRRTSSMMAVPSSRMRRWSWSSPKMLTSSSSSPKMKNNGIDELFVTFWRI